jgi:hypothetical protein
MKTIDAASELCTLVFAGDLPLLKRYIGAGIEVHQTLLHLWEAYEQLDSFGVSGLPVSLHRPSPTPCAPVSQVDAGDYDQRTALHIAACEQNLSAVRPACTASRVHLPLSIAAWCCKLVTGRYA